MGHAAMLYLSFLQYFLNPFFQRDKSRKDADGSLERGDGGIPSCCELLSARRPGGSDDLLVLQLPT